MGSLIGMGASGLFNAFAFSGMNYLFSMIDKGGYQKETKRHNKAMEKLAEAKEVWEENQVKNREKIQEYRQALSDANADINETNKAIELLRQVQKVSYENKTFTGEPVLTDYYKPSKEMEEYQHIAVGVTGVVGGWVAFKLLKFLV